MTLSRRWVHGAVWVVLLMVGSVLARAQEVSGSISGTVVDASGASVSGAIVTLTNTDRTFVERTLKTDKIGYYVASSLPLGHYSVSVAKNGFKSSTITGIMLHANDALKVNRKLEVGSSSDTVTNTAAWSRPNVGNAASEGLVSGIQVRDLPLVTRNFAQLMVLQPGVTYGSASNDQLYMGSSTPLGMTNQVLYSIDGQRPTANNWMVDGADDVDRGGVSPSSSNPGPLLAGGNLTLLLSPSVDDISEFVTLRGTYDAEYGRNSGGQINVITKSGTNGFHGNAYEYFRNDVFDADNYFNKLTSPTTPTPPLRYNDFGFTLGGPVVIPHVYNGRDKTFFFYSQEFRRVVQYQSLTSYVPTADERAGNFTNAWYQDSNGAWLQGPVAVCSGPNNGACATYSTNPSAITPSVFSPTAQAYINDIYNNVPTPPSEADVAAGLDPHTLISNVRNIFNDEQESIRIDEALNSRTNLYYRYTHDSMPTVEGGGLFPTANPMPGVSITSTRSPSTQQIAHATIVARPSLIFDMGYAYSSGKIDSKPTGYVSSANSASISPALPYPTTLGVVPSLTFAGNGPSILSNGYYRDDSINHNGFVGITKTMGRHTLKFGVTYNHYQTIENATGTNNQGNFGFAPALTPTAGQIGDAGAVAAPSEFDSEFANFLLGNANNGYSQASLAPTAFITQNTGEFYGQDAWRVSRRLMLNLGVRYSYFGQPFDLGSQLSNFDPSTYSAVNAQTISSTGYLCTMAGQTTPAYSYTTTGVVVTYTLANCPNVNGLNSYQPNMSADPLNGIILGDPGFISDQDLSGFLTYPYVAPSGAPAINTHGSPYGHQVGNAEKHNWAPRVGFAYDLFGNGKTSLRGGYGMVYDDASVNQYEREVFNNPPYVQQSTYPTASLDNVSGALTPNLAPPSLYGSPVIYKTPYVQQYSLDIQQSVTPTMTLDVGYFGDHGTHLLGVVDINEVKPGAFTQTSIGYSQGGPGCNGFSSQACEYPLNQIRPYLGYTAINATQTVFNSNYNSLQAKLTKKFSGDSLFDVNYTWSRGLTNAQDDSTTAAQNTYNLSGEYGPSAFNRNQVITIDGVWDLPWMREQQNLLGRIVGGWKVSGVYAISTGLPLTVTMAASPNVPINYAGLTSTYNGATNGGVPTDAAGLGIISQSLATLRPNQVLDPRNGYGQVSLKKRLNWFNQTAFAAPSIASFQVGNERPGSVVGPGYNRLDLSVFRSFRVYRTSTFTLRGEGFNILNHTNWGSVGTLANSTTFGQTTSTRDPRILQVAGQFSF